MEIVELSWPLLQDLELDQVPETCLAYAVMRRPGGFLLCVLAGQTAEEEALLGPSMELLVSPVVLTEAGEWARPDDTSPVSCVVVDLSQRASDAVTQADLGDSGARPFLDTFPLASEVVRKCRPSRHPKRLSDRGVRCTGQVQNSQPGRRRPQWHSLRLLQRPSRPSLPSSLFLPSRPRRGKGRQEVGPRSSLERSLSKVPGEGPEFPTGPTSPSEACRRPGRAPPERRSSRRSSCPRLYFVNPRHEQPPEDAGRTRPPRGALGYEDAGSSPSSNGPYSPGPCAAAGRPDDSVPGALRWVPRKVHEAEEKKRKAATEKEEGPEPGGAVASEPSQPSRLPGQAAKATVEKRKPSKAEPTSARETKKPAVAASGTASASKRKSEDPGDQERSELSLRPAEDRAEASKRKAADTERMIETIIAEERQSWIDWKELSSLLATWWMV